MRYSVCCSTAAFTVCGMTVKSIIISRKNYYAL